MTERTRTNDSSARTGTGSNTGTGGAPRLILAVVLMLAASMWTLAAGATTYAVDGAHTTVGFSISHLFTSVQGRFDKFDGTIIFDPDDPKKTVISGKIDAASINTNNAKRDKHLRSSDFFDIEKFPTLSFESKRVTNVRGNQADIEGDLTIHGVTRPVVIEAKFVGQGTDPWGNVRAGFSGRVTINRKDYGLNWNEALETGGFLVGDEVEIRLDVEAMPEG